MYIDVTINKYFLSLSLFKSFLLYLYVNIKEVHVLHKPFEALIHNFVLISTDKLELNE